MASKVVNVGVIGGGLMGKEVASAFGRWFMLREQECSPRLTAVADVNPSVLPWFDRVPTVQLKTTDYHELLADPDIDVVYAAVPHDLHERVYTDVLRSGKDLLAEKPFGIDLQSALRIATVVQETGKFVRCSSEFPFFPGAQAISRALSDLPSFGTLLEVNTAFLHSSDMDLAKPINWKRQIQHCGEAGVLNDLGMHACHLPLRHGLTPTSVFAQLQNLVPDRPDGRGGRAICDTWDNATLSCNLDNGAVMTLQTKRLSPGQTNTWSIEVLGTQRSLRFTTKQPKALWEAEGNTWKAVDLGHSAAFPVETGGIFEFGFPDALLQMWAAFFAERQGALNSRFGCATPEEAVQSHRLWAAALKSNESGRSEPLS